MNDHKAESVAACFAFSLGLFFSLSYFYATHVGWQAKTFISIVALFISNVLFTALIAGMVLGSMFACIIYPAQYFLVKRFSPLIGCVFFILGLGAGILIPFLIFHSIGN